MNIPNSWPSFNFGLGDDVDMLRRSVSEFAQDRIAPRADEIDRSNEFPRDLWPEMGALGLHGLPLGAGGGRGRATSRTAWLWRRCRGHPPRSVFPTARTRISASTNFAATARPSRR